MGELSVSLDGLLRAAAGRAPFSIAVSNAAGESLNYRELDERSEALGALMCAAGVVAGDRVGICLPKTLGSIVAVFAALRCGAAYVPVDAQAPTQRNAFVFADCAVRALIADSQRADDLVEALSSTAVTTVEDLGELGAAGEDLKLIAVEWREPSTFDDLPPGLAYILYTSGSTGLPKGVMHTHASALSFVDWCSKVLAPEPTDRFSSHAPLHFDLSIFDVFVAVKHRATIILIDEELGKQPLRLAPLIAEQRITVWYSTPSVLRTLLDYGKLEQHSMPQLRIVIFAGEVFPLKHLRRLQQVWPRPAYFNFYGPTETNVCTYFPAPCPLGEQPYDTLPVGYPCSGDRTRVVDESGNDIAAGAEGELIVAGGSVMHGYWNLPGRNADAFFVEDDGTKWYRTGDVVRADPQLGFQFIGRRDRMVKRRGYRVELGEVEAALYRHADIAEAAVIAKADAESGVRVVAFVVWAGEGKPSQIALKKHSAAHLPLYMIPDGFSFLEHLPKTSTDKIDYQTLKDLS